MSSIPAVTTTTRPTSAGRNFVALSFLVNVQYFNSRDSRSGHVSFTQWIHIVEWIVPFVKRIAAPTGACKKQELKQFDVEKKSSSTAFISLEATTAPALPSTMRRLANFEYAPWLTMLRHQAAEKSLITSGAAKKVLFSSRDNCNCLILKQFERTSYFLGIQAWVLRQNGKQKKYAQKSGQRSTFSFLISLFFIISQNACFNFFETAFELLLYRKYRKKI